jgi:DNA-directed RNA polymerase
MQDRDRYYSEKRVAKSEAYRARRLGDGFTGQASVIVDRYLPDLAEWIGANLADKRRSWAVRRAMRGLTNEDGARRLLLAGISVTMGKRFGVDEDDNKTARDVAIWIGYNFVCETRDAAKRVGDWAIRGLCTLPIFKPDKHEGLTILAGDVDDELRAAMAGWLRAAAAHHPLLSPQETPPVPWTGFRSGGVSAHDWPKLQLVRTNHKNVEDIIRRAMATTAMQPVLDAVNALQSVAFVINRPILDLLKLVGPPPAPDDALLAKTGKKARQKCRELEAARWNWFFDITVAEAASYADQLYIPMTLAFGGRLVPVPWLNFIREDRVRSLFLFANGEPINDDGVVWLKQFVARLADGNTFSDERRPSQLDLEGRLAWTERNLSHICDIGAAVLSGGNPDLEGIDDCFQFAAACTELAEAIEAGRNGREFITRLPIQFDASCSGLQHLCAMARADEGRYVNLGPTPPKVRYRTELDIYGLVQATVYADYSKDKFPHHSIFGDLVHPLERKLAKTPTMTKFYGCGTKKMAAQINDALLSIGKKASKKKKSALVVAIRDTIELVAPKAIEVFEWVQQLATICAKEKKLLRWTTKLGFPVVNEYHPSIPKEVKTPVLLKNGKQKRRNGKPVFRYTKVAVGYEDRIKVGKAITSVAANFVHSADACLLQMVALSCEKELIPLVTVHDCFATTANHAGRLKEILGEQFEAMYEYDWLENIWQSARAALPKSVELPPIPKRGNGSVKIENFQAFS